jgi:hypothetical protein
MSSVRSVGALLVLLLVAATVLDGQCLLSCAPDGHAGATSPSCHDTTAADAKLAALHDCSSHLALRVAAARLEQPVSSIPAPAIALAYVAAQPLMLATMEADLARVAPGPPLDPPHLVAVRI